jgi:hypothetical protein
VSIAAKLFAKITCPNTKLGSIVTKALPMTLLASGKEPKDPSQGQAGFPPRSDPDHQDWKVFMGRPDLLLEQ